MLGPVSTLQIKGAICACLNSQQESETSKAITTISKLSIQYSTQNSSENNNNKTNDKRGVGKFVSNLFSNAAAAVSASDESSANGFKRGRVKVVDSMQGPVLSFEREQDSLIGENMMVENSESNDNDNDIKENLTIGLKRVGAIEANTSFMTTSDAGIIIYKHLKGTKSLQSKSSSEKIELIRFDIFSSDPFGDGNDNVVSAEERDDIIECLNVVVAWDRSRRKNDPNKARQEDENDDEDTTNNKGNGLGQRALKAKYFIQKEIEMKKQAKDRESRKARYMKDSGGLKYTALAMANRQIT